MEEVCGDALEEVLEELRALNSIPPEEDWLQRPICELIDHILKRFHEKHRRDLPELIALALRVEEVHRHHEKCPKGLVLKLQNMSASMADHMAKEEQVLFPAIEQSADPAWLMNPICVMREEHEDLGRDLRDLQTITHHFALPEEACITWRALYKGIQELMDDLMEHVSLENNVLFPRVLCTT